MTTPGRLRVAVLVAVAALALAGCTETPSVVRSTTAPGGGATALGSDAPNPDQSADKRTAGIPDCPESDAGAAAVAGGLPELTLPCLGGGREVHLAGLRGKPMIINLWAQWCGPCRDEAPYLAQFAGSTSVDVIGIDTDDPDPDLAVAFAAESRWTYPQLYDPGKRLGSELQAPGIPTTLLVRADGTLAYRSTVAVGSAEQLRDLVRTHLGVTP